MPPFDPTGNGAYVPVNRIKPITADFVGDATKGGASNLQDFVDAQRMLKAPCKVLATTLAPHNYADGVITATISGALSIDGLSAELNVGDRVLVNLSTVAAQPNNGIYTVTSLGSSSTYFVLTRAADFNASADLIEGSTIWITDGLLSKGTLWQLKLNASSSPVLDTTSFVFEQIEVSGSGGGGGGGGTTIQVLKAPCLVAATKNLNCTYSNSSLTSNSNGSLGDLTGIPGIDGYISIGVGTRVLVHKQDNLLENGIYEISDNGSSTTPFVLTRAADAPSLELSQGIVDVIHGEQYGGTRWELTFISGNLYFYQIETKIPYLYPYCSYAGALSDTPFSGDMLIGSINGPLTLTSSSGAVQTIPSLTKYVLIKNEVTPLYNGIYKVFSVGSASEPYRLRRVATAENFKEGALVLADDTLYRAHLFTVSGISYVNFYSIGGTSGGGSGDYVLNPQTASFSWNADNILFIPSGRDQIKIITVTNAHPELLITLPDNAYDGQKVTIKDGAGNFGDSGINVSVVPYYDTESIDNQYTSDLPLQLTVSHMSITFVYYFDNGSGTWYII